MAFLEQFTPEQRSLLTGLPYRAGLWISQADARGTPLSEQDEKAALVSIIARQASGMFHSAFAHEIMAELWAQRDRLVQWENSGDTLLQDCMEATRLINAKMSRRDLDAYRATIMHIAIEVAKAFQESGNGNVFLTKIRLWRGRIGSFFRGEAYDPIALLNISDLEDKALDSLSAALALGADVAVDDTGIPDHPVRTEF